MGVEAALTTNLNNGRADKCRINMQTVQRRVGRWLQVYECMALDEPHRFIKINLDIIIYKTPKYLYLEQQNLTR